MFYVHKKSANLSGQNNQYMQNACYLPSILFLRDIWIVGRIVNLYFFPLIIEETACHYTKNS